MSVVNDIQAVVQNSKLFVEASKLEQTAGKKSKGRKRFKGNVKIGQGGTLDPLADGVLGEYHSFFSDVYLTHISWQ